MTFSKLFDKSRYELFTTSVFPQACRVQRKRQCRLTKPLFGMFSCTKNVIFRGNGSRDFGPSEPRVSAKETHHNGWPKDLQSIICAYTYWVRPTNGNRFSLHPHDYHRLMVADVSVNRYSPGSPGPSIRPHVYFQWNSISLRWKNRTKISIFRRPKVASVWRSRSKIVSNC